MDHTTILRPNVAYYYQRILANATLCVRAWHVDQRTLKIYLGQSDDCRGIQNNYEIRGEDRKRAYNGMNHQIHERGELGFDEGELVGPFSFAEIDAMRQACPDYHGRR